jgi:site-specific DNA-methyltransferase (adenine-specific)
VYLSGVVTTGIARGDDRLHLTAKPLDLLTVLVEVAPPCSTVLDPFVGSGTTLVAAKRLGRRAIGVEVDAASCAVAASRLAQASLFEAGPLSVGAADAGTDTGEP